MGIQTTPFHQGGKAQKKRESVFEKKVQEKRGASEKEMPQKLKRIMPRPSAIHGKRIFVPFFSIGGIFLWNKKACMCQRRIQGIENRRRNHNRDFFYTKKRTQKNCHSFQISLLPSRLYCRFWNLTKSCAFALADFTADREFHPALKSSLFFYKDSIALFSEKARKTFFEGKRHYL